MFKKSQFLGLGLAALMLVLAPAVHADLDSGMSHYKAQKYMEAAAEFQALVDNSPNYDFGYYMMGMSFLQMDKPADAEKNLVKAIELNGEKFEYHLALAKSYFDRKQYPKAVAVLKTAEPLAADSTTQYHLANLRGMSYAALEKWADAIDDLEKARRTQSSAAILDRLGRAYYELGHFDKALPVIRETLKQTPNNTAMQVRLANILMNLGAEATNDTEKSRYYAEAIETAKKFKAAAPNDLDANNLLGRAALGAQDFATAEQAFRKVLALKSDHCFAMANLGKTYIAQSRWADAENILSDAAGCAPRMAVVYEGLGFSQQKQQKLEQAIASYQKAYEIKPSPAIQNAINTCKENIAILAHNKDMEQLDATQIAAQEAEAKRLAEEKAKREKWEKERQKDN